MSINALEISAEKALRDVLNSVPSVTTIKLSSDAERDGKRPDLLAKVVWPEGEQMVVAEIRESGQPKPVRDGVNQIRAYLDLYTKAYGVIIAPYVSPRSAQICDDNGVGYIDLAGNCSIAFKQIYIRIEGRPNPFTNNRALKSLYSPKASRVLRALLVNPIDRTWKVKDLSEEADVSIGLVSNVKKLLEEREWIQPGGNGFTLSDPESLLMEWSENYSYRKNNILEYYSPLSISEIEEKLGKVCLELSIGYALTGFSGAARLSPTVRYQRVMSYISGDSEKIVEGMGLKGVSTGANILLFEPFDSGVFYGSTQIGELLITSAIQIFLDLKSYRGRGEEAANTLFEQELRINW